ncbi:hypothetical protein NDU88_002494 [Pleurodeles waltl]|uniref:Uncharacterized protein n=1 Tax=Pleurodeles waltl TaxID=8319 RepID=A0AAV7MNY3_PLEWA|nr:hypothetical protein NDU88_002494 [Pleurodeles waltl]
MTRDITGRPRTMGNNVKGAKSKTSSPASSRQRSGSGQRLSGELWKDSAAKQDAAQLISPLPPSSPAMSGRLNSEERYPLTSGCTAQAMNASTHSPILDTMALSGNFMSSDTTAHMIPNGNLQLKEKHIYLLFSLSGDHANKAANKNKAKGLGQDLMLPGDERSTRLGWEPQLMPAVE